MATLDLNPGQPDTVRGPYGTARRFPATTYRDTWPAALDAWIITAPQAHPLWSQYRLTVVTLADVPGAPPAVRHRPGTTHEVLVCALNPEHGPYDATVDPDRMHILTPVNICEQITTTDDRARELVELCAAAVVDGLLWPETGDAPDRIRAQWSTTIAQTLNHHRDPQHGRAN